jgi:hypothetical protein
MAKRRSSACGEDQFAASVFRLSGCARGTAGSAGAIAGFRSGRSAGAVRVRRDATAGTVQRRVICVAGHFAVGRICCVPAGTESGVASGVTAGAALVAIASDKSDGCCRTNDGKYFFHKAPWLLIGVKGFSSSLTPQKIQAASMPAYYAGMEAASVNTPDVKRLAKARVLQCTSQEEGAISRKQS